MGKRSTKDYSIIREGGKREQWYNHVLHVPGPSPEEEQKRDNDNNDDDDE